jgi:hypothetical protein
MADELPPELEEAARQFAQQMRSSASAMGSMDAQTRNLVTTIANGAPVTRDMLRQLTQAGNQATNALKKFGDGAMGVTSSVVKLIGDMGRGSADLKLFHSAIDGVTAGVGMLGGAFTGLSSALGKSAKFTGAVDKITGGVGDVAGILGDLAKYMVNVFDDGIKSFQNLSKVGGVGADGIESMAEQFRAMGLPMQRYEQIVRSNTEALAKMGGTVSSSAGIFADELGNIKTSGLDQGLRNLGMGSEEIAETMISYADLQRRLGVDQYMDQQRLRQGTIAYGKELDEIARITGMSREQAAKEADRAMSNARFNAKIRTMIANGQTAEAENLRKMNAVYTKYGMEKGFQDMSTGFLNTAEAQQMFIASNGQAYEATQRVANGQADYLQGLRQAQTGVKNMEGTMTSFSLAAGNGAGQFGDFAKNMDFASANIDDMSKAAEDQGKTLRSPNQQTEDLMKSFKDLELASSDLQSAFLTIETVPSLMADSAEAFKKGAKLLADVIRNEGVNVEAEKERYKTPVQKDIDADIKSTQELIDSGNLTAEEQVKTRERLDELVKLQDKAVKAQKATKTAIEQGGGPLGIKITDSLKADQLNKEVSEGYEKLNPAAARTPTYTPPDRPDGPSMLDLMFDKDAWKNYQAPTTPAGPAQIALTPATPADAVNNLIKPKETETAQMSPAPNNDAVVDAINGMRSEMSQGFENLRNETSKGNRINANR